MSTDKTLADVQPGGRVRLGDQAERARFDEFLSRNPLMALCAGTAWQVWQAALSAQRSPGGQDALTALVAKWRAAAAEHELISLEADSVGLTKAAMRNDARHHVLEAAADDLEAALAARQPVGEPVAWLIERLRGKGYGRDKYVALKGQASSDPDSHLFWTDQQARDNHRVTPLYVSPAQDVDLPYSLDADPAGIRARVCDVITGTLMVGAQGHTPPPAGHWAEPFWQAARADAKAQAVDLEQFREPIAAWSKHCAHSIKGYESYQDSDLPDWMAERRQQVRKCGELLALIDSHSGVSRD